MMKPFPILVLSPEYTFLVAPALADIYFTTDIFFYFKGLSLKDDGRWSNLVTIFGFSNAEPINKALFLQERNSCRPE